MTKRGYLAKKLSQYIGFVEEDGDSLFYLSLSTPSFLHATDQNEQEYLLYLSECLLEWQDQGKDIPKNIELLSVKTSIHNALLRVYETHKQEFFPSPVQANKQEIPVEQKEDSNWEVYRDVIFAATQGKFLLISEDELVHYKTGTVFCEGTIKVRSDIPECRNRAKESLELQGFAKTKIMGWLLILSEAITNTIKHAEEGKMTLVEDEANNELRFIVTDKGPGFALKDLPKMTLLAGYSTKKSMGQGFTLMMKMSKQILLCTSPKGSTIILCFESSKEVGRDQNATG